MLIVFVGATLVAIPNKSRLKPLLQKIFRVGFRFGQGFDRL
jgi:hypothetical protein